MRGQSGRSVDARVGFGRRDFIRAVGACGAAWGLARKPLSALADASPAHGKATGKAKSVIQIGIWGGMSQFETWDPKPKAAPEYRSAFKPIPTNVPGIEICETLPMMASTSSLATRPARIARARNSASDSPVNRRLRTWPAYQTPDDVCATGRGTNA